MPCKRAEDRAATKQRYVERYPDRVKQSKEKYKLSNLEKVKESKHKHYCANKEEFDTKARKRQQILKKEKRRIQDWITERFESVPCMDCNKLWLFCAMDFDHRPEEVKSFCVSKMNGRVTSATNIAMVMKEIDKCDYVCAGCHRVRTWKRHNSC